MADASIEKAVLAAQRGDEAALSELIELTQDRLFRFCMYLCGNPHLAQDLCQDVFIKTLEKIKNLEDPKQFVSWLFTMARNLFIDHVRSPKNKRHDSVDDVNREYILGTSEDASFSLEVQEVLVKLDPDERMLLLLVDLEEYSYAEAAQVIGISEDAVRSRLHRARKEFLKRYKKSA